MIKSMNQEKFLVETKELRCRADWHRRYYSDRANTFHRIDYWCRCFVGLAAFFGAIMALSGVPKFQTIGIILSSTSAIIIANFLPIFKWDDIVSGFKSEEEEWTRIFKGYEEIISFAEISDRGEILVQELQRIKEMQKAAALNDRMLPKSQQLFDKYEKEVREYYGLNT